jgi:hypothetical protein
MDLSSDQPLQLLTCLGHVEKEKREGLETLTPSRSWSGARKLKRDGEVVAPDARRGQDVASHGENIEEGRRGKPPIQPAPRVG